MTAAAGWAAARVAVSRIARNRDPFPREKLAREPEGEQVFVGRPDGTTLRAVVAGDGPPVVLAHGYGVSLLEWNVAWEQLIARGYRVIAFDQRGHGGSTLGSGGVGSGAMAADYAAVLHHFDVRDAVLVGHSMGGFVAIRSVVDHPELADRLRGLVLFATWAGRILDGAPQNRLQIPLLRTGVLPWLIRTRTVGVLFAAAQCGRNPSPAMISVFREVVSRQDHRPLLPIVRAFADEDRYPRLPEITVPTIVMVGSADRSTPSSHARRLAAGVPGARLVTVPDAGHLLNWEAPDTLVDVVAELSPLAGPTSTGQPADQV
ncbi:alpha/beta fold hydrolase [Couchioplanes azureus]|uniref:alpha/beta fold hydrolase n=1 Tax=Couchioplanes caeruleus TaxID=56438 RepID=UPI001E2F0C62|nr:alpha/beta fold hydrolase [Couchioplanes caeruleus]